MEDPIEEEKQRLRIAAANETEEFKEVVGELATAAKTQSHEVIGKGRWLSLYAGFTLGLFIGLSR
jgi:hypothetical protein